MSYGEDTRDFLNLLGGDVRLNQRGLHAFRRGVFSENPASTPKYSTSNRDPGIETMARLMVPLSSPTVQEEFIASFGDKDTESKKLARYLATIGKTNEGGDDPTTRYGLGYVDFLLQSAQENYEEKVQIVDVLSDNYVAYFFGARPSIFQYSGILLNTRQDDWRSAFTILYNDILRGTELARRQAVATLSYDDMAVTGTLLSMSQNLTADMQMAAQFNFSFLVQRVDVLRTLNSVPTQVQSFPSQVKPDAFATQQFEVPPRTIRTASAPTNTTVERKKKPALGEGGIEEEYRISDDAATRADTYGAGVRGGGADLDVDTDVGP